MSYKFEFFLLTNWRCPYMCFLHLNKQFSFQDIRVGTQSKGGGRREKTNERRGDRSVSDSDTEISLKITCMALAYFTFICYIFQRCYITIPLIKINFENSSFRKLCSFFHISQCPLLVEFYQIVANGIARYNKLKWRNLTLLSWIYYQLTAY